MTLILLLLLMVAVLAVVIRIADARGSGGFVALGILLLSLAAIGTNRFMDVAPVISWTSSVTAAEDDVAERIAADDEAEAEVSELAVLKKTKRNRSPKADDPDASETASATEDPASEAGETVEDADDAIEITIEPETVGVVIPPRPDWVEAEEVRKGKLHTTAVSSGPHETEKECRRFLNMELQESVDDYIDWYLSNDYGDRFRASNFIHYDVEEIKRRLVPEDKIYHEVIKVSFGPMHQMHARLEFDEGFRRELDQRRSELNQHWRAWVVTGRLLGTGLGFGVVLAFLSVFFTYFRLDTATRGFYTGRLQFSAAAVILAVLVAGVWLASQILQL